MRLTTSGHVPNPLPGMAGSPCGEARGPGIPVTNLKIGAKSIIDLITLHQSPIYDECQTQSAKVLARPWERAHQDIFNNTSQPMFEFQLGFLLWIRQDKPTATLKGGQHAPIWNSYCGVSLKWSWCACSHDRDTPFAERNLAFNIDWRV